MPDAGCSFREDGKFGSLLLAIQVFPGIVTRACLGNLTRFSLSTGELDRRLPSNRFLSGFG